MDEIHKQIISILLEAAKLGKWKGGLEAQQITDLVNKFSKLLESAKQKGYEEALRDIRHISLAEQSEEKVEEHNTGYEVNFGKDERDGL